MKTWEEILEFLQRHKLVNGKAVYGTIITLIVEASKKDDPFIELMKAKHLIQTEIRRHGKHHEDTGTKEG